MLKIGKNVFRNLPEQVGYNTSQIEKIFETLDGLSVQDNVVSVPDMSYVLTDDELKIVRQAVAFIVYNGEVYIKKSEDSASAYFELVFTVSESAGVITVSAKEIQVTLANGGLALVTSSAATYSRIKLDTLLAAKSDLSGANFTGPITAPSIIENMSGYSWVLNPNISGANIEMIYVGVCKNGNKLTFALFGKITNTSADDIYLGNFYIPEDIRQDLYTYVVEGANVLAQQSLQFFKTSGLSNLPTAATVEFVKVPAGVFVNIRKLSQLTVGVEYTFRIEQTFLLNDNLAA